MSDSLEDYKKKRDFGRTPEPAPKRRDGDPGPAPVFVVHRHEARNLHYDLRLEVDGVLWSWAVPKGFSYDPADKRLAVRTEDHPLEYEDFHGVIPKGEYGAGTMTIWDKGRYEHLLDPATGTAKGELKLLLYGRRLRGEWHLVKTKGGPKHWLLFKSKDRFAGPARDSVLGVDISDAPEADVPLDLEPMRAGGEAEAFSDPDWLFEMQFAGRRAFAYKRGEDVGLAGMEDVPALRRPLAGLRAGAALLDGVLVALDDRDRPSLERLEAHVDEGADARLAYYAFDLLQFEDYDLRGLTLMDRKSALRAVLPAGTPELLYADHVIANGDGLLAAVEAAGLPGVVAKRSGAPYVSGESDDWLTISADAEDGAADLAVSEALTRKRPERGASRVKLSNLGKVFWPAEGYTKGDLIAYYEQVADFLLPYLKGRPVHMLRYPDGIEGKSFYQRHAAGQVPDWVEVVEIQEEGKEPEDFIVCGDRDTLLFLVNLGSIDLHPWFSRVATPRSPDWAVIDLDPKEAPFSHVVRIARAVGKLLRGIGLRPVLKTSGATGLHVYIPLVPGYTYQQARMFCETVARVIAREHSDIATVTRKVEARGGKVYVDFGQNGREQTIAGPYVVRPVPGAQVATPLQWDELEGDLHPSNFTIRNVPERLDRLGDLFRPVLNDPQDLMPAIEKLQGYMREG